MAEVWAYRTQTVSSQAPQPAVANRTRIHLLGRLQVRARHQGSRRRRWIRGRQAGCLTSLRADSLLPASMRARLSLRDRTAGPRLVRRQRSPAGSLPVVLLRRFVGLFVSRGGRLQACGGLIAMISRMLAWQHLQTYSAPFRCTESTPMRPLPTNVSAGLWYTLASSGISPKSSSSRLGDTVVRGSVIGGRTARTTA